MGPAETKLRSECARLNLRYVGTRGNVGAHVCVVGEAPGADENREGFPFVGASGKEQDRMLAEAGFQPNDCWFTNPYKVQPPNNDETRIAELGISEAMYIEQFWEEINAYKPTIIIAAGATPLSILCPHTRSKRDGISKITQWRGSLLSSDRISWPHYVVPVLHPAAILRDWSERQIAVLCYGRAFEEFDHLRRHKQLLPLPIRELITTPSYPQVMEFLQEAINQKEDVSNDIETIFGRWPYTISIATSPKRAISFGLWDYDLDDLLSIWRRLDYLLRNHRQIGQNYIGFDCPQLYTLGFDPCVNLVSDTMVRHHTLWPEFEHKLQFQTFQYTREPYYKDEGKLWSPKEGKGRLQLYNCKDSTVTYEIHDRQEEDFNDRPYLRSFYSDYAIRRARAFYRVEGNGVLVDKDRLADLRKFILTEIEKRCKIVEGEVGRPVVDGKCGFPGHKKSCACKIRAAAQAAGCKVGEVLNLASPKQLLELFDSRKIKIPIKRGAKGKPSRKSVDEIALRKVVLNYPKEPLPMPILDVRELLKMKGTYIDAKLLDNVLYTSYSPTATVTGRSGSRTNSFGYGTNLQNLPKHSDLGLRYRDCIVARSGTIFLSCDQKGAEDWIVQGIISDVVGHTNRGLQDLIDGINRHKKLAAYLFAKPEAMIDKAGMEYYMGKKTRHAGNYGMESETMAEQLLKEGFNIPRPYCEWLLLKFHAAEPEIKQVFHKFIIDELTNNRRLITPLGFERIFFGLHPFRDNSKIFREGFAQIPQSTVGTNTGMALVYLDDHGAKILKEDHDALTLEVADNFDAIWDATNLLQKAFDRVIRFKHGLELVIPIEVELGYTLGRMKTCPDHSKKAGLMSTYQSLQDTPKAHVAGTGGVLSPS